MPKEIKPRILANNKKTMNKDCDRYAQFFSFSLDMLCIAGFDGYFKELNSCWESTLGFSKKELLAKQWIDFVHPDDKKITVAAGEQLFGSHEIIAFENRYRCKNGEYKWFLWNAKPIPQEKRIYAVARDITERKKMENELRKNKEELEILVKQRTEEAIKLQVQFLHSQKMESVGRLAGGVAHDFNNILTAILGSCSFLFENLKDQDPNKEDVREIKEAAERAVFLTRQLLVFSRQQVMQLKILNLSQVAKGMEKLLRRLLREDIELVFACKDDISFIKADEGQMEQVIMNLVVNAIDAMPKGGKLTVETANDELGEEFVRRHLGSKTGPHVVLSISDTGIGMDKETQSKIFEPFFTTKEKGKGTGLGLATVYGIVKQSGGNIWVYSESGHGTVFKIYFPVAVDKVKPRNEPALLKATKRGTETILIVEDDEKILKLTSRTLSVKGYKVLEASDGEAALSLVKTHKGVIDMIIVDMIMPKLGGREVVDRLAPRYPKAKILYMSGYTEDATIRQGILELGSGFLQKPFTPDILSETVRQILDS